MKYAEALKSAMQDSIKSKQGFMQQDDQLEQFHQAVTKLVEAYRAGEGSILPVMADQRRMLSIWQRSLYVVWVETEHPFLRRH